MKSLSPFENELATMPSAICPLSAGPHAVPAHLHGEVDLVDRAENLVDLADGRLVLEDCAAELNRDLRVAHRLAR